MACSRLGTRSAMGAFMVAAAVLCSPAWSGSGDVLWEQEIATGYNVIGPQLAAVDSWVFAHSTDYSTGPPVEVLNAYWAVSGQHAWEARGRAGWDKVALGQSVAAVRDRVFTATELLPEGRGNSSVAEITAREAATGALLWTREFNDENHYLIWQIAANRDAVFVVGRRTRVGRSQAMILALDVVTGKTLWSDLFTFAGSYDEAQRVALAKGRVIVSASSTVSTSKSSDPSVLRAYDAQTGRLLWQTDRADRRFVNMTAYRSRVYAVGMKSAAIVSAYDIGSGERLWKRRIKGASSDSISAARKAVAIFGRDFRGNSVLQVLDRKSGQPLWASKHEDTWGFQVLGYRGRLYAIGIQEVEAGLFFAAFKHKTGRLLWSYPDRYPEKVDETTTGWQMLVHRNTLLAAITDKAVVTAIEP